MVEVPHAALQDLSDLGVALVTLLRRRILNQGVDAHVVAQDLAFGRLLDVVDERIDGESENVSFFEDFGDLQVNTHLVAI